MHGTMARPSNSAAGSALIDQGSDAVLPMGVTQGKCGGTGYSSTKAEAIDTLAEAVTRFVALRTKP
jgi:hypothetical protein